MRPTQSYETEHGDMPSQRIEEGFDPIAYKLLTNTGYSPQESTALGKLSSKAIRKNVAWFEFNSKHTQAKGLCCSKFSYWPWVHSTCSCAYCDKEVK